jgi:hypothetical protein
MFENDLMVCAGLRAGVPNGGKERAPTAQSAGTLLWRRLGMVDPSLLHRHRRSDRGLTKWERAHLRTRLSSMCRQVEVFDHNVDPRAPTEGAKVGLGWGLTRVEVVRPVDRWRLSTTTLTPSDNFFEEGDKVDTGWGLTSGGS